MGVSLRTELDIANRRSPRNGHYWIGQHRFRIRIGDPIPEGAVLDEDETTSPNDAELNVDITQHQVYQDALAELARITEENLRLQAELEAAATASTAEPATPDAPDDPDGAGDEAADDGKRAKPKPANRSKGAAPENRSN